MAFAGPRNGDQFELDALNKYLRRLGRLAIYHDAVLAIDFQSRNLSR
jgi:hypothetical protein